MRVKLPFGTLIIVDQLSATVPIYNVCNELYRNFKNVKFNIQRDSEKLIRIKISVDWISESHIVEEDFKMMVGDAFRLQYGRTIILEGVEKDGIVVSFEKYYDTERYIISKSTLRKLKLEKLQ